MSEEQSAPVTEEQIVKATEEMKKVSQVNNPEDIAAAFFKLSEPRFNLLVNRMSVRQVSRAIKKALLFPFAGDNVNLQSPDEENLAYLVSEMIMHKMIMQLHYETKKFEEAEKQLQAQESTDNVNTETNQDTKGEQVNG